MTFQQVLQMSTWGSSLRSEAWGWSGDDASLFDVRKGTGLSLSWDPRRNGSYSYETPMHALALGWKLLAPPARYRENGRDAYDWWFVREVTADGKLATVPGAGGESR